MKTLILALALAALLNPTVATPAGSDATDWSQWRGPSRDGSSPGDDWPEGLDGLREVWRVPLGKGYPGPIIAAGRVFVVENIDEETVGVRALDGATGAEIWNKTWASGGKVPFFATANGDWVRSTPAFDGRTLYVGDMLEVLVALDGETGRERWRVDLPERFDTPVPDFGFASSPLVDGDAIYVQAANSVVKLDRRNGETIWRAAETSAKITASGAFSSPVIAEIHGVRQLVALTRHSLFGLSLDDGAVLWSQDVPNFRGMNIQTPVIHDNTVLTSPYKNGSFLFAIRRDGDRFSVEQLWTNKAKGYMSTPVVIDGHAYMHLGNGRVDCIDLASGESRWRSESFGNYWSMVLRDDKILALSESGTLYLVRADPQRFELLDSREISEQEAWGHLAVKDDLVVVRELEAVAAYRW